MTVLLAGLRRAGGMLDADAPTEGSSARARLPQQDAEGRAEQMKIAIGSLAGGMHPRHGRSRGLRRCHRRLRLRFLRHPGWQRLVLRPVQLLPRPRPGLHPGRVQQTVPHVLERLGVGMARRPAPVRLLQRVGRPSRRRQP